jgi:hypothetical protein
VQLVESDLQMEMVEMRDTADADATLQKLSIRPAWRFNTRAI